MKKYFMLLGIRIAIYVLLFICIAVFSDTPLFFCSTCYIENSVCLGGYGGLNVISILVGFIIPLIIFELIYLIISRKVKIKKTTLTIIMTIIFISLNLGMFKFMGYFDRFYNDEYCNYCATVTNCNEDYTNCSVIDSDGTKLENLNCSYYFD